VRFRALRRFARARVRALRPSSARTRRALRARAAYAFALALFACACDSGEEQADTDAAERDAGAEDASAGEADRAELPLLPLIDQTEWRNYAPELDPLPSHQPDPIMCNIAGWFVERGSLEVSTGNCNYILVEHPAQLAVPKGGSVHLELVHFDLEAPEPATAHVALFFGDDLQWELTVPIPSLAYVYKETFPATRALKVGEPIRFHLHNHGQNTWLLDSLYAQVPAQ
jgi:hypothetical protein